MTYLIDTNVLSETIKDKPNPNVIQWFKSVPSDELYISVLVLGEIKQGIEKLQNSKKKTILVNWLDHSLVTWFGSNILPISREIAERWGYINGTHKKSLAAIDTLIAATALTHNLKLVTRNNKDFPVLGLELINPFN